MEWSTPTSNVQNERVDFMPSPGLESNGWLHSFSYDPYAGNSYATMQTKPVITVPDSEMMINTYQCDPSNNDEMIKKKKRLTSEQLASLEICFQEDIKLDTERKLKLSKELGLQPRQTAVWFQNRRARWKVKHLEESYNSLRQEYDNVWREKQMLHDEVRKLKAIILRDQGLMMNNNQIAGGDHANNGIGEYNSPMMVGSSHVLWPGISQPPNPW